MLGPDFAVFFTTAGPGVEGARERPSPPQSGRMWVSSLNPLSARRLPPSMKDDI